MKKTMLLLFISTFTATLLFGVTALVSKGMSKKYVECSPTTSSVYTIEEFIPPTKTRYSLNEINTYSQNPDGSGKYILTQEIEFDGAGMSMTVKNNEKNDTQKYTYNCDYFELDGELLKFEDYFWFDFNIEENANENGILTPGEYTADVILITDDGGYVTSEFDFTIEITPESDSQTETTVPSEPQNEIATEQETTQSSEKNDLVMPSLRRLWHKVNDQGGHIEVLQQNGNDLCLLVTNTHNGKHFMSTKINLTLKDVHMVDGVMKGTSAFQYTDSAGNQGVGTIAVSENSIVLNMNQEYDSDTGWSVNNATGKYLLKHK